MMGNAEGQQIPMQRGGKVSEGKKKRRVSGEKQEKRGTKGGVRGIWVKSTVRGWELVVA